MVLFKKAIDYLEDAETTRKESVKLAKLCGF
jgi:hypothetical protein